MNHGVIDFLVEFGVMCFFVEKRHLVTKHAFFSWILLGIVICSAVCHLFKQWQWVVRLRHFPMSIQTNAAHLEDHPI